MNTPTDTRQHYEPRPDVPRGNEPGMIDHVVTGAVAGFIAGICVAVSAMLHTGITGPEEAWLPMKLVAGTWGGVDVLVGGGGTIAVGLATHLGVSTGWGLVFGVATSWIRNAMLKVIAGLLWGGLVWIVMTWGFMPWLDPTMTVRINISPYWWWWLLHIIYGVILGIMAVALGRLFRPERERL